MFTHFRAEYWDNSLFTREWLQTLINWFQLNWKCKDCNNLFCGDDERLRWEWGFLLLYFHIFCWCDIYFTRRLLKLAHLFCGRFCKCRTCEMIIFVKPSPWQVRQTNIAILKVAKCKRKVYTQTHPSCNFITCQVVTRSLFIISLYP